MDRKDLEPLFVVVSIQLGLSWLTYIPRDISEKKAPNQSIVKNKRSIPTILPLRFTSSNGIGRYPAINSRNAIIPMSRTGHDTPFEYDLRITNTNRTCNAAKMAQRIAHASIAFHLGHLLQLRQQHLFRAHLNTRGHTFHNIYTVPNWSYTIRRNIAVAPAMRYWISARWHICQKAHRKQTTVAS
jgi:hypothetical protein